MERISITERPDWREKATEYGFNFHTMYGEPYWSEEAYYKLTLAQVEKLEDVTAELHQMCLQAVEKVIASDDLMTKFRIPKHTWGFVRQSWKTHQPSLYSRLDLAWDGVGEPKLLENQCRYADLAVRSGILPVDLDGRSAERRSAACGQRSV